MTLIATNFDHLMSICQDHSDLPFLFIFESKIFIKVFGLKKKLKTQIFKSQFV